MDIITANTRAASTGNIGFPRLMWASYTTSIVHLMSSWDRELSGIRLVFCPLLDVLSRSSDPRVTPPCCRQQHATLQVRPNTDEDERTAGTGSLTQPASNVAISTTAGDDSGDKGPAGEASSRRAGLFPSTGPPAIVAEPTNPPAPTFPSLHMASLVADPGGMRCLAVGLAVLQKICPLVYHRLAMAASDR